MKTPYPDRCDLAAAAIILLATSVFVICARGELWFDEVLSLQWAKNASTPWQLLTDYRHDNNHLLNSLWLWLVGIKAPELVLRALAVASGAATLVLIYLLGGIFSPRTKLVPLILAAGSYAIVLYSSEARGYAPALAASLGCLWIWLRAEGRPTLPAILAFWALAAAGLLAHPTVVYFLAALGCWQLGRKHLADRARLEDVRNALLWFSPPAGWAMVLYIFFFRGMDVAGGPTLTPLAIAADFFHHGLGIPGGPDHPWVGVIAGAALTLAGLVWGSHPLAGQRIFFLMLLVVFPVLGYWLAGREYVYFRYFLVCLPPLFLLLGCLAERLWLAGQVGKAFVYVALALSLGAQIPPVLELARQGRGACLAVLQTIKQGSGGLTDVFSDHDMLVGMVFEHYRASEPGGDSIVYRTQWSMPAGHCEWLLAQPARLPVTATREIDGQLYHHVQTFFRSRVSGADWILYRRASM